MDLTFAPDHPTADTHPDTDAEPGLICGRHLRYLLTVLLFSNGPLPIAELVDEVESLGFRIAERPSKAISDALRWEIGRGRVVRHGRGRYGPGRMPDSTARRIRKHVRLLIERQRPPTP